ncbi:MAG: glycosyltransferase family 2 protein [Pseudomonadales bacterium]|nr:glycosyltransferase family 2 protein [Pseudomonadales bacterium]MCP5188072.1 glycosyltransferase family 2 protein [Pseudomonadales bacterium]
MKATTSKLSITVLLAVKNEEANLPKCLMSLGRVERVILLDSQSKDSTAEIAANFDAEVVQFHYSGGYPKKRQWGLNELDIRTDWVFLLDADEVVSGSLWQEIEAAIIAPDSPDAFLMVKGFHFLGKRFRFGGFSHSAVLLFRRGAAAFEELDASVDTGLDMEVHERVIVSGSVGAIAVPLIHEDFKGLQAYIDRHNKYSTWEAGVRYSNLRKGIYGTKTITPRLFGNAQERRRFLKNIAIRMPFEPALWFFYHYVFRLGFLEGKRGLIASQIRASYISQARAKLYELELAERGKA